MPSGGRTCHAMFLWASVLCKAGFVDEWCGRHRAATCAGADSDRGTVCFELRWRRRCRCRVTRRRCGHGEGSPIRTINSMVKKKVKKSTLNFMTSQLNIIIKSLYWYCWYLLFNLMIHRTPSCSISTARWCCRSTMNGVDGWSFPVSCRRLSGNGCTNVVSIWGGRGWSVIDGSFRLGRW